MHLIDLDVGFLGSTPIVGGTVPLAVGSAWASSLNQNGRITVVFFGDGCFEEGVVHESMNFAALHKLPVIFVCENNNFSVYTHVDERQPERPIYRLAEAHGMAAYTGDGNNVEEVLAISRNAVALARQGKAPVHGAAYLPLARALRPNFDDHLNYRTVREIEAGMNSCPITSYTRKLEQENRDSHLEIAQFEAEIQGEIAAAFEFALSSKEPNFNDAQGKSMPDMQRLISRSQRQSGKA